jgi:hypothetical protein
MHTWRPAPLNEESVREQVRPKRTIRAETSSGRVLLDVTTVRYPLVEGRAYPGGGEVLFDVTAASRAETVVGATSSPLVSRPEDMRSAALPGKLVRFHTEAGPLLLEVASFEYPLARGKPRGCPTERGKEAPCPGKVQLDLREAGGLAVWKVDGGKTALVTVLAIGIPWAIGVLIYAHSPGT